MFGQGNDAGGFSGGAFVAQLVLVPPITVILGTILGFFLVPFRLVLNDALAAYLAFAGAGLSLGFAVGSRSRVAIESGGKWIWILPAFILAVGAWRDFRNSSTKVLSYFVPLPGDEGLVLLLLTLPAVGSAFYGIGLSIAANRTRGSKQSKQGQTGSLWEIE